MLKVTVLGSGNAFCSDGRAQAAFHLQSRSASMLLDAGATTLKQCKTFAVDPGSLDLVLLTHFHGDHFLGLVFILLELDFLCHRQRPLDIAGPPGLTERCEALLNLAYPEYRPPFLLRYHPLTGPAHLCGFQIEPVPVRHRPESLGYRIRESEGRSLSFSGDTAFDPVLFDLYDGVDLGLLEVSLHVPEPGVAHVALSEVLGARQSFRAGRMLFTHLTDAIAARLEEVWPGSAARDGQQILLS
ncbi:MAG: MBL fold metallo-hydrolase [Spirochaetales bacterium]|nr:MBL fold metallo-hydrolase [Spirochaetales bacterium]